MATLLSRELLWYCVNSVCGIEEGMKSGQIEIMNEHAVRNNYICETLL